MIFTAQANAQTSPKFVKGECFIVPGQIIDAPPGVMNERYFTQIAVGQMELENATVNGLINSCRRLALYTSRNGLRAVRKEVGIMLFMNGKLIDFGKYQ
jgi:hypothetical protein